MNNHHVMTSSNGTIFRVTGPVWVESTGHRWIPLTRASDVEIWCILWSAHKQAVEQTSDAPVLGTTSRSLWRHFYADFQPASAVLHERLPNVSSSVETSFLIQPSIEKRAGISNRADSRFAPSQWETALICNDVSHWLGSSLESTMSNTLSKKWMIIYWSNIEYNLQWDIKCQCNPPEQLRLITHLQKKELDDTKHIWCLEDEIAAYLQLYSMKMIKFGEQIWGSNAGR